MIISLQYKEIKIANNISLKTFSHIENHPYFTSDHLGLTFLIVKFSKTRSQSIFTVSKKFLDNMFEEFPDIDFNSYIVEREVVFNHETKERVKKDENELIIRRMDLDQYIMDEIFKYTRERLSVGLVSFKRETSPEFKLQISLERLEEEKTTFADLFSKSIKSTKANKAGIPII